MKKILTLILLTGIGINAFSQLHIRANIGYNLPMNSQVIGVNTEGTYSQSGYDGSQENVYGSYGSGFSFHAAVGGSINGAFGFDIEAGYLLGKEYSSKYFFYDGEVNYTTTRVSESHSRSLQFSPSFTMTAGSENIQPYVRMGPVLTFTKLNYTSSEVEEDDGTVMFETEEKGTIKGDVSIGLKGVVGVIFNGTKKIQFFSELNFVSMSFSPKEGEITSYTVDGEDALDTLEPEDRNKKYEDTVDYNDEGVELKKKLSMGSFGIQAGVRFMLR
jgi:hypothetical protein